MFFNSQIENYCGNHVPLYKLKQASICFPQCSSLHIYFQVFWLTKSIILYHLTKVRRQTHSRVPYKVSHELDACFPRSLQPSLKAKKLLCV